MPSGPWATSVRMQELQFAANSVTVPSGVMRAIFAGAPVTSVPSVNQRFPSEPVVMPRGWLFAVGTLYCLSAPTGAAIAAPAADNARPAASVIASARPTRLDMGPSLWTGPEKEGSPCLPAATSEVWAGTHLQRKYGAGPPLDLVEG